MNNKTAQPNLSGVTAGSNSKIPVSMFLNAVRHAPRGCRLAIARRLLPSLSEATPPSRAEICEFNSPNEYLKNYRQLATILGRDEKTPPPGEIEFLHAMLHRPAQRPGTIGWSDYFFLTAFVSILAPQRVLEIGTLTGFSAAVIAAALSRQHGNDSATWVDTIDVRPQCLIDDTRPTGFEIPELIPNLTSMVRLHIPHDSAFVSELAKREELQIVFIDADHRHPRPLLDLLRLAPYVRPDGWILLHDIQLGTIGEKMRASGEPTPWGAPYGGEWLFDSWPWRKISGGNIGAVQLPNDKSALIPFALRLMSMPFEINGKNGKATVRARRALYQSFSELI